MSDKKAAYKHVLITGASSGIGAALAEALAAPGLTLSLAGRDEKRLKAVAKSCEAKGAKTQCHVFDVTDRAASEAAIRAADQQAPLDLVIANAGISPASGDGKALEDFSAQRDVFATNLIGLVNTLEPAAEVMRARGHGQLALMSSLASFHGYAVSPSYCGSKAAVRVYGEGLRSALRKEGIKVNVICPGFVKSPLTAGNTFPMPQLMESDKAARLILKGLLRNKPRIVFPYPLGFFAWLGGVLPPDVVAWVIERRL